MKRESMHILRWALICSILLAGSGTAVTTASTTDEGCERGLYSGGEYLICMPDEGEWNGELVVYGHGYVAPENPVAIPDEQLALPGGLSITNTITSLGFAFAATSYITNGLVVRQAVTDVVDLVGLFATEETTPTHVYLVGASEGGLVTALATEQHRDVFDGGLATCGPVGDFRRQVDYWGDVRVLFDYFFPDVLPKFTPDQDPLIPRDVIANWYGCDNPDRNTNYGCADPDERTAYETLVRDALVGHPWRTRQLLRVARVPEKSGDDDANIEALVQLLWYNVFATDDGVGKLGGQPYDNTPRWYWGSGNDWRLNREVVRFDADPAAISEIEDQYQTSGDLSVPIVTLHTLKDPVVPYWHEPIYRSKVWRNRDWALHTNIPGLRYGHCNFGAAEALFAFGLLVYQVRGHGLDDVAAVLTPSEFAEYERMAQEHGLGPEFNGPGEDVAMGRDMEPVVVTGAQLSHLAGTPTDALFVYAQGDDGLRQIPFQVDEVEASGAYTSTIGSPLDEDDEVVFMAADLGDRLLDEAEITTTLAISPTWYRIQVRDPVSETTKGWAYIVRSSNLTKTFTQTYVSLDPVSERITTTRYALGFASAFPGFEYLALNNSGVDILDRTKIRVSMALGTFNEEQLGSFFGTEPITVIKDGSVRALATNRVTVYRFTVEQSPAFVVPIALTAARFSTDFSQEAVGATFYNADTPLGVTIDGISDTVDLDSLSPWWQVSGETGTLVEVVDSSGTGGTPTSYYKDDATEDPKDTGDQRSYGDTGLKVDSPSRTISYRRVLYVLPPEQPNVGARYAAYAADPLQVTATAPTDVAVKKTGPEQSMIGDVITYTVTISNTSSSGAPDLVLDTMEDSLVGGLESLATTNGCDVLVTDEVCSFTYTYTVQSGEPGPLTNTVEVHYHHQGLDDDVSDRDAHRLELFAGSVEVEKTGPEQSRVGDVVTYTVTISNTSSSDAPDLVLDTIGDSLVGDLVGVATDNGCDILVTDEVCSFGYTYTVQIGDPDPLTNTVEVRYRSQGFENQVTDWDDHELDVHREQMYLPLVLRN